MDTKQKNRDGSQDPRQRRDAARRPARDDRARKQTPARQEQRRSSQNAGKRTAPAQEQRRRDPQAARQAQERAAEAARQQAMQQAAQQAAYQAQQQAAQQAAPLPEEEVYRPTPTRERHSQDSRRQPAQSAERAPAKRRASSKRRPFGKSAARQKAKASGAKRSVRPPRKNAPAVIYTQPLPFNLNRLLVQLLTVTALVLAFTTALSIFFKVEVVTVSGADVYSEWAVREASGIEEGDALLTFSRARAGARIRTELPYVDRVRFGIKLPNTVIIDIEELEVAYAIQATDGMWWFITSEGRVVEQTDGGTASNYTKIEGVTIEYPEVNSTAVAWEQRVATDPTETGSETVTSDTSGTTAPVVVTNADRLAAALQIVQALEDSDVVGEVATVNVSDLGAIMLTYGTRYEVKLGNTDNLAYKITCMRDAIAQMSDYQKGVIDVTFSIWTDKVVFTPAED